MQGEEAIILVSHHPFDLWPMWAMYVISVVILLLAAEMGRRLSKYMQGRSPDKAEFVVGALSGATLALLAFLLAFVVNSAVNSFSDRRHAVVAEANGISTAWLRAGFLPEPIRQQSRQLLSEYVNVRLEALDPAMTLQAIARSEEIHAELWSMVETLIGEGYSPALGLYVSAINEIIELNTNRIYVAIVARVPWTIVLGLFLIATVSLGMVGLYSGYAERQNAVALFVFVLILSVVFLLIVDLNRGQSGLLTVSQQPMFELQRSIGTVP